MAAVLKAWTWSELAERMDGFWPAGAPVPDDAFADCICAQVSKTAFESGPAAIWLPLRSCQPLTWHELSRLPPVRLVRYKKYPALFDWVVQSGDLAIFAESFGPGDDQGSLDWLRAHLPDFLLAYYTTFNGMRGSRFQPMAPGNLPANDSKWHRLSDFAKEESVPGRRLKALKAKFGNLDDVFIFLKTDWNDLLLLDFNRCDRTVYVVPCLRFEEFFALSNAAEVVDRLCAHVISGADAPFFLERFR